MHTSGINAVRAEHVVDEHAFGHRALPGGEAAAAEDRREVESRRSAAALPGMA